MTPEPAPLAAEPAAQPAAPADPTSLLSLIEGKEEISLSDFRRATEKGTPVEKPVATVPAAAAPAAEAPAVEAPASEPAAPGVAESPKPKPDRHSVQARFDHLSKQLHERDDRLAAQDARIAELEARLSEPAPVAAPRTEPKGPTADEEPQDTQFEIYTDFVKAHSKWAARQEARESERRQVIEFHTRAQREAEQRQLAQFHTHLANARKKYPDYDTVVTADELPLSATMQTALVYSDLGAELAYYLGQHPDDSRRIYQLPPARQLVELGKLEARLDARFAPRAPDVAAASSATPPPVTQAEPPIQPVGHTALASPTLETLTAGTEISLKAMRAARGRR